MSDLLQSLNPEQKKAVEHFYGPLLVLAGPGTGKTHLLTTKIAALLQSDIGAEAQNILCLTFTESGAVQMRDRLQKWIGNEAYKVKISTFHGFCEGVMQDHPETFEKERGPRTVADDLQKALVFRQVIQSQKWETLKNIWDDFLFQRDILKNISQLKRENISPEKFREILPQEKKRLEEDPQNYYQKKYKNFQAGDFKPAAAIKIKARIEKMYEFCDFWEAFDEALAKNGYFDFDDQIRWVVEKLQTSEDLRFSLQERFQWILVDEYQDTNSAQNHILWALTEGNDSNIMAVGDDDQSIYRFQGASVENLFEFQKHFPDAGSITLKKNYRSAQNILDTAFEVIENNLQRVDPEKKLLAHGDNKKFSGKVTKSVLGSVYAEIAFLVQNIQDQIQKGVPPHEIAVLVRKNSEVLVLAQEISKFGIPVSAQVFEDIFQNPFVKMLLLMLRIFDSPERDDLLMELLHSPFWDLSPENLILYSLHHKKEKNKPLVEFLIEKSDQDPALEKVINLIVKSRKNYTHCRPEVLTEKLLYESGLAAHITNLPSGEMIKAWQNIQKYVSWTREQKCDHLHEILDRIDLHQKLRIAVRPDPLPGDKKSIQIMTAHKSKGKEFDIVFIPGIWDGVWSNTKDRTKIPLPFLGEQEHDPNEDERRLFFVALTRARQEIFLSYSTTDFSGRDKNPALFWHEIHDDKVEILETEATEMSLQKIIPILLAHQETPPLLEEEKKVIEENVKRFVWSATTLNTFLECPRAFLFQYLYHFPRRPTPQMALGTSLHQALERGLRMMKTSPEAPSDEVFLQEYLHALRGQNLEKEKYQELLDHGQKILTHYLSQRRETFSSDALLEFDFEKHHPQIQDIRIRGIVDRVDFLNPEKTQAVILDYKSGAPKSIKKGERLWRQLVFYDLLVRSCSRLGWQVDHCALEFLTPDQNQKIQQKTYRVTEEDRQIVINELQDAHQKIHHFEFPIVPNPEKKADIDFWQNFGRSSLSSPL